MTGALGVMALGSVMIFGASASSAHVAKTAAAKCSASIAIEAPFATGPATQLGLDQLHFAQLALAMANKANKTNITMGKDDTGLNPSLATTRTNSIIASSAVAAVGPAGSQEVEAVGPLFSKAGLAFVSGSATLPALATSGNKTFFRVVPDDNIQGPNDAKYIINHKLAPSGSTILIIDDQEAYSEGLVAVMTPILQKAGYTVNHQSYNGTDTGATLQSDFSSLATSQVNANTKVVILPWQSPANAEQFGQTMQQQGKTPILFGTDGTNSPGQFEISGAYVSNFGPDISTGKTPLDKALVSGVKKYGPYAAFGVPTWEATTVVADAISSVCKAGNKPSRSNVLAAIRKTNISAKNSAMGVPIKFQSNGDLTAKAGYLFHINTKGDYTEIPDK
ncbi:MAG TPA: branched-chain amino acid ABC transporter substrate-binding protein [Solirubrobacteraceae bacterium]|nr:branched-chain amino acid ABC transporter substrate-binding protein [Solirubrobacteraceae bacterium]